MQTNIGQKKIEDEKILQTRKHLEVQVDSSLKVQCLKKTDLNLVDFDNFHKDRTKKEKCTNMYLDIELGIEKIY